jgi:DNA-binding transcriptional LysR family regulator
VRKACSAVQRSSRGEADQLNIGYVANVFHNLLPATLGAFRKACPRTALNLFDMTPAEQYEALEARKIDLGFVCLRARPTGSELHWACVGHDVMTAAVAAGSPLAQKAKIDLKDLEPMYLCTAGQSLRDLKVLLQDLIARRMNAG